MKIAKHGEIIKSREFDIFALRTSKGVNGVDYKGTANAGQINDIQANRSLTERRHNIFLKPKDDRTYGERVLDGPFGGWIQELKHSEGTQSDGGNSSFNRGRYHQGEAEKCKSGVEKRLTRRKDGERISFPCPVDETTPHLCDFVQ